MRVPDQHRSTLLRGRQPIDNPSTFTVDLLPLDGEADATGTYTVWFGDNVPKKGNGAATFTLNGQITYPDGTTWSFHHVDHTTFAEGDVPKHEFSKMHCTQIG
jgi:hypothetical protein